MTMQKSISMTTKDPSLISNYYERITCAVQWKEFNRALAAELTAGLPPEENRRLFTRIGERMARNLPIARCDTLAELQSAFNACWERIDWGVGILEETDDHVSIVHACSPMAMAFGPDSSDWAAGLFEGAYQTWFTAQGIPPDLRVRSETPPDVATAVAPTRRVHLKLARFSS